MKFIIKHEIKGRMRIHVQQKRMSYQEADILEYYLTDLEFVQSAKIYKRTQDISVSYSGGREAVIEALKCFQYEEAEVPDTYLQNSGRELNEHYWDKLVTKVVLRAGSKLFLPYPVRAAVTGVKSVKYIWQGVKTLAKGKIQVPVLDGTAIGVSLLRNDIDTAGSIMFLLGVGEILEEWTHKKSVDDLARSMSLHVDKVWLLRDEQEILVPGSEIKADDLVVVHMGNVIPFDGIVVKGEAMVNQASFTGESMPVRKCADSYVYAGTVIEEGELTVRVKQTTGSSKFEKIVTMIEESEKLKSSLEGKAEHLADRLVPYTLAGSALAWLLTGNTNKALAVLMVDFSCALKLAMPQPSSVSKILCGKRPQKW